MRFRRLVRAIAVVVSTVALEACGRATPATSPPPVPLERVEAANQLLTDGCLDCLISAYQEFEALRSVPALEQPATTGAARAALLVAMRQRELGMVDEGYRQIARDLIDGVTPVPEWLLTAADVADAVSEATGRTWPPASDADLDRTLRLRANRAAWATALRPVAATDPLAAYAWLELSCGRHADGSNDDGQEALGALGDVPLLRFKRAICPALNGPRMQALLDADPRLVEANYLLGMASVARTDLDRADELYGRAYAWHPRWPGLTQAMANVAMTAEEFDRAAQRYGETLDVLPRAPDALLGKVRALTYLGHHEEAVATTDLLLNEQWHVGDARYWRALNETQLRRLDAAWTDIEAAAGLLINAEVPKLAGLIAYRRGELDVSRGKFAEAHQRNAADCETVYYLGLVLVDLRAWDTAATTLTGAASCFDGAERDLRAEIAAIIGSSQPVDRQARQLARRERQLASNARMRATSWFNIAVAYYSVSRPQDARSYAERLLDDEQFRERAKEILARLR